MGFLDFFAGSSPEKHEQKADAFVISRSYGHAKIEYEKALDRLRRQPDVKPGYRNFIEDKLRRCKESLAREHRQNGEALVEAGCGDEARELFQLALELTADPRLAADINSRLDTIPENFTPPEDYEFIDTDSAGVAEPEMPAPESDEEYFSALCNALDDAEREVYRGYSDTFKQGFIALNRGDFTTAVALLSEAGSAYPFAANYIALELATAHLNLGENKQARTLLESFLQEQPDSLKAYYLLCDIFWEEEEFNAAHALLSGCPDTLSDSLPFKMLVGETLLREKHFKQAASFFHELLETRGWNTHVAQALAGAYEALGLNEKARGLYGEIMAACTGCGAHVDPVVKQRYAATSFETGDVSTQVLELFLDLVREDPANRLDYYHKISRIYSLQGNESESRRFAAFAQRLAEETES